RPPQAGQGALLRRRRLTRSLPLRPEAETRCLRGAGDVSPRRNAPRVLYICGSINQTTQLRAVYEAMGDHAAFFTPYYGDWVVDRMRHFGLIEMTIGGNKRRGWCLDYLAKNGLAVDLDGKGGGYDLVVTCTDLVIPKNVRRYPIVVVQEGILDPESWISRACRSTPFPNWLAGTTCTGESGLYDRFCVASDRYRHDFIRRGAHP